MYNQLSNWRRQVSNKCPLFGKSTLLLFFWSIRNSWLLLAIKKPSEALAGNLKTNKIHIYIQYPVRCCVVGKRGEQDMDCKFPQHTRSEDHRNQLSG